MNDPIACERPRGAYRLPIEREDVLGLMPHAPGWVLVDRVVECRAPDFIVTHRYVSETDPFVAGHFRGGPAVLPGVLLVEYVGQSAYLLGRLAAADLEGPPPVRLLARCSASFLSAVSAGDLLTAEVSLEDRVRDVAVYDGVVRCGSRLVCRAKVYGASPPEASPEDPPGGGVRVGTEGRS